MEQKEGVCPKCNKEGLKYGLFGDIDEDSTEFPAKCKHCGFEGFEQHTMQFKQFLTSELEEIE